MEQKSPGRLPDIFSEADFVLVKTIDTHNVPPAFVTLILESELHLTHGNKSIKRFTITRKIGLNAT